MLCARKSLNFRERHVARNDASKAIGMSRSDESTWAWACLHLKGRTSDYKMWAIGHPHFCSGFVREGGLRNCLGFVWLGKSHLPSIDRLLNYTRMHDSYTSNALIHLLLFSIHVWTISQPFHIHCAAHELALFRCGGVDLCLFHGSSEHSQAPAR